MILRFMVFAFQVDDVHFDRIALKNCDGWKEVCSAPEAPNEIWTGNLLLVCRSTALSCVWSPPS